MAGKKGGWGWASTILGVASLGVGFGLFAISKIGAIALIAGMVATGYQESKFQQRQAMRAYKKAFGSIGDNALAGSPTYSWEGPQTVSDPSLPVPLCYGEVTVGGNIINAWTETVNIFATKWEAVTPVKIEDDGDPFGVWPNFTNIIRTDSASRGVRIRFKNYTVSAGDEGNSPYSVTYKISYKVTGGATWVVSHPSVIPHKKNEPIVINPERNLIDRQYDIKIEIVQAPAFPSSSYTYLTNLVYYDIVYSAHENSQDTDNVAGHKDLQYLTIALAEGEIQSADEGGVTLNDNPLSNYGKDYYIYDYTLGANSQVSHSVFDNIVTENSVSYKAITNDASPITVTTQNQDVQSLILILSFPYGLYQITDGKIAAWQADFTISYRKVGDASWLTATKTIKIKNNNPFKQAIKIDVAEGQYEVKVVKTSTDPDGTATIGEIWWVGLQEYVSQAQHFPNTAVAYLRLQATDQSSGAIPNVKFKIKGKLVEVPKLTIGGITVPYHSTYWSGSNYVLDAVWNGNAVGTVCTDASLFVSQWTNNPIWCLRDLINNDYYGLKSYFQSTLNDSDLRLLAKYCDEKVDNGQGGTDKRFQLDIVIDSQDDARNVIERILSTFRGFAVWAENQFKIKINKAENPVQLFTMGNIIENSLSINYSSASDRFNVAKITYPDNKDAQARMSEVMIYDVPAGGQERSQTFNLIGITRRSQAVRMGRFFLNQAKYIKESVQFKAGLDSIACEAGDVIEFAHDVTGYGLASGRIKASTINSITIDTPISINVLNTYKVKVKLSDDTIEERTVHNTNSTPPYTLVMTSNFTSIPPVDSTYAFGESGTVTKPYRVLSINRDSIQERQITAIEDNASIYLDTGDAVEPISYSSLKNPLKIPDSVTNLTLKELTVDPGDGTKINNILVSWNPPTLIDDPSILPIVTTATTGGSITAGTYYCKYTWIGAGGETMASNYASIVTTGSTSTITLIVPSFSVDATSALVYVGTTIGQEKYQGQITQSAGSIVLTTIPLSGNAIPLTNSTQNDTNYDRAKVYISDSAGAFWEYRGEGRSNFIIENVDKLTYKIAIVSLSLYGIAQSISDATKDDLTILGHTALPPDVTFNTSNYTTTNDATYLTSSPEANTGTINDDWNFIYGVKLTWNPVVLQDLAFYEIRLSDSGWGTTDANLIYRGLGTTFILENPKQSSYTFYIKARNTSGYYSQTAGSITVSNSAPVLSDIYSDFTGKDCRLWWQEVQDEDFKEYQILIYSDSGRTKLIHSDRTTDPLYNYTHELNIQDNGTSGLRMLYITIKALDMLGQSGTKNISVSNNAPPAPTNLYASNFMEFVYLSWNPVIDIDLAGYNIYVNGIKKATVNNPGYVHTGDEGVTYNYYVKAIDSFGEGNQSTTVQGTAQGLNIAPTDIDDFAVTASKLFTKIPVLENDTWIDNSNNGTAGSMAGSIWWSAHQLYYNGVKHNINAGTTSDKYIYWDGNSSNYQTYASSPTLTDDQFIISTNISGFHDLAWNAIANEVIGSAYIASLAVNDGHIANLSVGKLTSGTIDAKTITLVRTDNGGPYDCIVRSGKSMFGDNANGFILGVEYGTGLIKFELGDANSYLKWTGTGLSIKGSVTVTSQIRTSDITEPITDGVSRLVIGSDGLRLYNSSASIMANLRTDGTFTFGDYLNGKGIDWNGNTLDIRGKINANDIQSGGAIIGNTISTSTGNERIELRRDTKEARWYDSYGTEIISIGSEDASDWALFKSSYTLPSGSISMSGAYISQQVSNRTSGSYYGYIGIIGDTQLGVTGVGVQGIASGVGNCIGGNFAGATVDMRLGVNPATCTDYKGRTMRVSSSEIYRKIAYGIMGKVAANGDIISGSGFTCSVASSIYTVAFDDDLNVVPVIVATPNEYRIVKIYDVTESGFNLAMVDRGSSGNLEHDFDFFAIIP